MKFKEKRILRRTIPLSTDRPYKSYISHLLDLTIHFKALLVPQICEVEEGYKGSGDDDHPWLEVNVRGLFPDYDDHDDNRHH